MNKKKRRCKPPANRYGIGLNSLLALLVLLFSIAIMFSIFFVLTNLNILHTQSFTQLGMAIIIAASLMIGALISTIIRKMLKPLGQIINAAEKIADGDYSIRIDIDPANALGELGNSFNHMAQELSSVELLRSDFINDFSHEFKTPIISIKGFAKMLKDDRITDAERQEYLDIIISESDRLSEMSTRILMLSSLEKQSILTDKKDFNLSEQIRVSVVLLEKKWESKKLDINLQCDEIQINANQELLQEVWLNLIDNAIKFSPDGEDILITVRESDNDITISLTNKCGVMTAYQTNHLFDKFYQADASHTTAGNGLGLPIVKKIVELHKGSITVKPGNGDLTFLVCLPKQP